MKTPCEVIVWDVLPSIRAPLADELVKNGLSQKGLLKCSELHLQLSLNIKKRGYKIDFKEAVKDEIKNLQTDIIQGGVDNLGPRICEICMKLMRERTDWF